MQTLLQITWAVSQWKNYENRSTSDEVIIKVKRCAFLWNTVYITHSYDGAVLSHRPILSFRQTMSHRLIVSPLWSDCCTTAHWNCLIVLASFSITISQYSSMGIAPFTNIVIHYYLILERQQQLQQEIDAPTSENNLVTRDVNQLSVNGLSIEPVIGCEHYTVSQKMPTFFIWL